MSVARPLQILIVDDNAFNRLTIQNIVNKTIKQSGVFFAENGEVAVDICNKQAFDIIFMDYHMPIMNGDIATQQIRNGSENLNPLNSCFMINCSTDYKGELYDGASAELQKPFTKGQLEGLLIENGKGDYLQEEESHSMLRSRSIGRLFEETKNIVESDDSEQSSDELKNNKNCCKRFCTIL